MSEFGDTRCTGINVNYMHKTQTGMNMHRLPRGNSECEVYMPRCKEAAAGPNEYSRHRVQSPLVVLRAWHKMLCLMVIGLTHHTQTLSQYV